MYLDPGFGSMLIQVLVASLAAAGAMIGIFRNRIKAFFSRNKKSADADNTDLEKQDDEDGGGEGDENEE